MNKVHPAYLKAARGITLTTDDFEHLIRTVLGRHYPKTFFLFTLVPSNGFPRLSIQWVGFPGRKRLWPKIARYFTSLPTLELQSDGNIDTRDRRDSRVKAVFPKVKLLLHREEGAGAKVVTSYSASPIPR